MSRPNDNLHTKTHVLFKIPIRSSKNGEEGQKNMGTGEITVSGC